MSTKLWVLDQKLPPIYWCPGDILEVISSFAGRAVVPLRVTCKLFNTHSKTAFEIFKKQFFIDKFGARAESEQDIPVDILVNRATSYAAINAKIGIIKFSHYSLEEAKRLEQFQKRQIERLQNLWLKIDDGAVPRLVNYRELFFGKALPTLELLKIKYRFYRHEFHQERDRQLQSLLDQQNKIALEFDQRPLNLAYPLQDLRDRCRRLQTLDVERSILVNALKVSKQCYNDFLDNLPPMEKVLFSVTSFFHSYFQKAYQDTFQIPLLLPVSFKSLNEKGVKLGETKITDRQGVETPVKITVKFGTYDGATFAKRTIFEIKRTSDDQSLGEFGIAKSWIPADSPGDFHSEASFNAGKYDGILKNRHLYIHSFEDDEGQNPFNGDRPIMRLLTQIAMEVFQLESENKLIINSHHADGHVYYAAGFSLNYKSDAFIQELQECVQKAREENKLFPAYENMSSFNVSLQKSPSNPLTQFVRKDKNRPEQPALVDFDLDQSPTTWEEQIKNHRLLSITKGPILPKFFEQDLSRFEVPEPIIQKPSQIPQPL